MIREYLISRGINPVTANVATSEFIAGTVKMVNVEELIMGYLDPSDPLPHTYILKVIKRIRDSFSGSVEVYTGGSCIKFALILKSILSQGVVLYDMNHAIFEYGGACYDINGWAKKEEHHVPLTDSGLNRLVDLLNLMYPTPVDKALPDDRRFFETVINAVTQLPEDKQAEVIEFVTKKLSECG